MFTQGGRSQGCSCPPFPGERHWKVGGRHWDSLRNKQESSWSLLDPSPQWQILLIRNAWINSLQTPTQQQQLVGSRKYKTWGNNGMCGASKSGLAGDPEGSCSDPEGRQGEIPAFSSWHTNLGSLLGKAPQDAIPHHPPPLAGNFSLQKVRKIPFYPQQEGSQ